MAVRTIPFDAGQQQGIDKALLSGQFSLVRNGVLLRDGQLRPRPAYTALPTTTYGTGGFVAYDLASLNDRLVALADALARGYATDLFEYLDDSGAAAWRPTVVSPTAPRLPRATNVRDLTQPPDQENGVANFSCAAFGDFVCLVWNANNSAQSGYVHVTNSVTGQTLLLAPVAGRQLVVTELPNVARFVIVGINAARTSTSAWFFRPGSDETLQDLDLTLMAGTNFRTCAVTAVHGLSTNFVVAAIDSGGDISVARFDVSGIPQGSYNDIAAGVQAASNSISVLATSTGDRVIVGALPNLHTSLYTYDFSSGGAASGPFQAQAGDNIGQSIVFDAVPPNLWVATTVTDNDQYEVHYNSFNATAGTFGSEQTLTGIYLVSSLAFSDGDLIFAIRQGEEVDSQSNHLVAVTATDRRSLVTLACKDFEISSAQTDTGAPLSSVVVSTNGKLYWANATKAADDQLSPRVTECEISSPERRQVCQVGAQLVISGGMPVAYDGVRMAELGFLNRPVIVSVTGASGGALFVDAPYFYKLIWEALDADDNIVRSAVGAFFEYQSTDDAADVVGTTPITMRLNRGSGDTGSSVRAKLYRTVAVVEETAAVVTGGQGIDPPSGVLTGLTLRVIDSSGLNVVTFSALATTQSAVLSEINAVLAPTTVATSSNGILTLTSAAVGQSQYVLVQRVGTANPILGFSTSADTFVFGTTVATAGDVFHLCSTEYVPPLTQGVNITFNDVMSDDDLREQQILYVQAENPLDHHAPGPSDYVASGSDGMTVAGQPKRDRWTGSKPFANSQGIQFANPGRDKFSRRIRGDIEAITQRDEEIVLFTRRDVWSVTGAGPLRDGKGDFQSQRQTYGQGGMRRLGWRSLATISDGTFFQLDDDKIYVMGPGGDMTWIGHAVVETLTLYPVIVATCHIKALQQLAFACQSEDGGSGVIIRYDLRRKQWFEDDVGPVAALAEYDGRLAIIVDGEVLLQDAEFGNGTAPVLTARLGSFLNFGSLGWGAITCFTLLGSYRGPCTIELQISYNDALSWVTCGTFTLDGSGYVVGQPIELEFYPAIQECSRFAIQAIVTGTTEDSGGAWLLACDVHDDKDAGPARKGQSFTR